MDLDLFISKRSEQILVLCSVNASNRRKPTLDTQSLLSDYLSR